MVRGRVGVLACSHCTVDATRLRDEQQDGDVRLSGLGWSAGACWKIIVACVRHVAADRCARVPEVD